MCRRQTPNSARAHVCVRETETEKRGEQNGGELTDVWSTRACTQGQQLPHGVPARRRRRRRRLTLVKPTAVLQSSVGPDAPLRLYTNCV